jgi:hypothetical protein
VRAVEMLAAGAPLGPETLGLCTGDRRLARFWDALGIKSATWSGNNAFTVSQRMSSRLFPILTDVQCRELAEILVARGFADPGPGPGPNRYSLAAPPTTTDEPAWRPRQAVSQAELVQPGEVRREYTAVGGVSLHLMSQVTHRVYYRWASTWGHFPKTTDWFVTNGYYSLAELFLALAKAFFRADLADRLARDLYHLP